MKSIFTLSLIVALSPLLAQQDYKKVNLDSLTDISHHNIKAPQEVTSLLFNSKGDKLFIGSTDKSLYTFDLNTHQNLWTKSGAEYAPIAAVHIPQSTFFLSAQSEESGGKIKLLSWDVGQESSTLSTYTGGPTGIDYYEGKVAWAGKNDKLFEFDININQYTTHANWILHRGNVTTVTYTSEGTIVTGGDDGVVFKWDGPEPEEITYFNNIVSCVTSSKYIKNAPTNSSTVAAGDASGCLKVIDFQSGQLVYTDTLTSPIPLILFHPTDPNLLIVANASELHFIDIEGGEKLKKLTMKETITALSIAEDGSKIAVGLKSGEVKLYSL